MVDLPKKGTIVGLPKKGTTLGGLLIKDMDVSKD